MSLATMALPRLAEMRKYSTLSRLCAIASILLASPLDSVRKSLFEPFVGKEEKPGDFDFMKKKWNSLTCDERATINNQPYKFLRLRYGINRTAGALYPIIRLMFIHVIPSTIVLRWGFDEVAINDWQLAVKAFFMTLYAVYLAGVVFVFFRTLVTDRVNFAAFFLVPIKNIRPQPWDGAGSPNLWDGPGSRIPGSGMDPVPWLGGFLIWFTFGLELVLAEYLLGIVESEYSAERFWQLYFGTKWSIALVCLFFCLTEANPQFWNLAGAFLGSMSFFGYVFFFGFDHPDRQ